MSERTCVICGEAIAPRKGTEVTCGSQFCREQNRREGARRREQRRVRSYRQSGHFVAVERAERVRVLKELVRWSEVVEEAEARSEPAAERAARKRVEELVELLGFDPLTYLPDRTVEAASREENALGAIVSRRQQAILRAIPGTTSELAEAANIRSQDVRPYMKAFLDRGVVTCRMDGRVTHWEVA